MIESDLLIPAIILKIGVSGKLLISLMFATSNIAFFFYCCIVFSRKFPEDIQHEYRNRNYYQQCKNKLKKPHNDPQNIKIYDLYSIT